MQAPSQNQDKNDVSNSKNYLNRQLDEGAEREGSSTLSEISSEESKKMEPTTLSLKKSDSSDRSLGSINHLNGTIYEIMIAALFLQLGKRFNIKYEFFRAQEKVIWKSNHGPTEVDIIFRNRDSIDLKQLKELIIGKRTIFLGTLNNDQKLDPLEEEKLTIQSDSLVLIEAKKSGKELKEAGNQQCDNLDKLISWIEYMKDPQKVTKNKDPLSFIKFNRNEHQLCTWATQGKQLSVHLIIITNGDSNDCTINVQQQGWSTLISDFLKNPNPIIKLQVTFLYVPTFIEDNVLLNVFEEIYRAKQDLIDEQLKVKILQLEEENKKQQEEIKKQQEEMKKQQEIINSFLSELEEIKQQKKSIFATFFALIPLGILLIKNHLNE